jgi:hypothetical protein
MENLRSLADHVVAQGGIVALENPVVFAALVVGSLSEM